MKYLVRMFRLSLLAALLVTTALSAKPVAQVYALGSPIMVTTEDPAISDGHGCSLMEAIANAYADSAIYPDCTSGFPGNDTITFLATVNTITLNSTVFTLSIRDLGGLTIDGGGHVTISGNNKYRLLFLGQDASLILKNLTLYGGYVGPADGGGAVYNFAGHLTVINSVFYFNNADYGGAIYNYYGSLNIANSLFLENLSNDPVIDGGAIYINGGSAILTNNTFHFNRAQVGGDLYALVGMVRLYNNIFAESLGGGHCAMQSGADISGHNNLFTDADTACGFTNGVNGNILGQDAAFQAGSVALSSSSPAIDAGSNADCAAAPVSNSSYNGVARPSGYRCDIGAYEYLQTPVPGTMTFYSTATQDGHILESSETSNKGGSMNNTSTMLYIGDNAANKQYRAILSFDTFNLPPDVVITSVTLRLKPAGVAGTNPFKTHGNLLADVKQYGFHDNPALELADFQAPATMSTVLSFTNTKDLGGFYTQALDPSNFQYIYRYGVTQFKLRFAKDDNNDFGADYLKIYSGGSISGTQPELIIEYIDYVK